MEGSPPFLPISPPPFPSPLLSPPSSSGTQYGSGAGEYGSLSQQPEGIAVPGQERKSTASGSLASTLTESFASFRDLGSAVGQSTKEAFVGQTFGFFFLCFFLVFVPVFFFSRNRVKLVSLSFSSFPFSFSFSLSSPFSRMIAGYYDSKAFSNSQRNKLKKRQKRIAESNSLSFSFSFSFPLSFPLLLPHLLSRETKGSCWSIWEVQSRCCSLPPCFRNGWGAFYEA